jgi:putative Mn2+ efflux pump MntP
MYEHRSRPIVPWPVFLRRAARHFGLAVVVLALAVGLGTVGYRVTNGLGWVDAFLNASMILSGMGPVDRMESTSAKLFAACYALFSGLMFIGITGVILAPWLHRLMHHVHLDRN